MEIYNEEINDLLAPEHRKLQIHENLEVVYIYIFQACPYLVTGVIFVFLNALHTFSLKSQRGIYVAGLREEIVASPEQVLNLMEFGECNLSVAFYLCFAF